MPAVITKTGITDFDEIRLQRVLQGDGVTYDYYRAVGYNVATDEGQSFPPSRRQGPLTGTAKTRAETQFADAIAAINSAEGLP